MLIVKIVRQSLEDDNVNKVEVNLQRLNINLFKKK